MEWDMFRCLKLRPTSYLYTKIFQNNVCFASWKRTNIEEVKCIQRQIPKIQLFNKLNKSKDLKFEPWQQEKDNRNCGKKKGNLNNNNLQYFCKKQN